MTTKALSLRAAYDFGDAHGLAEDVKAIREMEVEWDRAGSSSLRRGRIVELFESRGVFDEFCREHWPFSSTEKGAQKLRFYRRLNSDYNAFLRGEDPEVGEPEEDATDTFALEAHLRDFLAANMGRIEPGLTLYDREGVRGVEYPVDGGRIDLLGVDSKGTLVVIELKLSRGRSKALGQLLYYMGWVDQRLGGKCRGVIIASDITEELRVAVSRTPGISLAQYRLSFAIQSVAGPSASATAV